MLFAVAIVQSPSLYSSVYVSCLLLYFGADISDWIFSRSQNVHSRNAGHHAVTLLLERARALGCTLPDDLLSASAPPSNAQLSAPSVPADASSVSDISPSVDAHVEAKATPFVPVLMHAFDGKAAVALRAARAGFFFSVAPSVCRSEHMQKCGDSLRYVSSLLSAHDFISVMIYFALLCFVFCRSCRLVRALPLRCLVLETDAPALSATANQRNEPAFLLSSLRAIADLKVCACCALKSIFR